MEAFLLDVLKLALGGIAGYIFGVSKDRRERLISSRDALVDRVRQLARDATQYHATCGKAPDAEGACVLLAADLELLRSEINALGRCCNGDYQSCKTAYIAFFDAVSQYPFRPTEMPSVIDGPRAKDIVTTCDELMQSVQRLEPRAFDLRRRQK